MLNYTNVEEQVQSIDPNRKVEISLRDLMYAYQTIGLLINFFHEPLHYPALESVNEFMGIENDSGAFHLLKDVYYKRLYDLWPEDVRRAFDEVRFDNPNPPYYYKPNSG